MKTATISGAVIAALAVGALATPTFAQSYRGDAYNNGCQTRSDGTAGAVIGGIAGALLGSNLASHHGGRAGGAALGGVAGALIGNSIARGHDSCDTYRQAYRAPAYQAQGYGYGYGDRYASAYRTPVYQAPVYQAPVYETPVYQAPAYGYGYDNRYAYSRNTRYERPDYDRDHRDYRDR